MRVLRIGRPPETRCDQVPDKPGAEMQHDTSVHQIELAATLNRLAWISTENYLPK
jgi:hypothetical protein